MKISRGKQAGLQAVSDTRGVIAALAIDQRDTLRKLLAKAKNVPASEIPGQMLEQFKEAVSRTLTPHTSAILLDPEYGLAAARARAKTAGLLLAYEQTGYEKTVPGRLPRLLSGYSVERLVAEGADCVKVLLYYSPFSTVSINDQKRAWVEGVGAECAVADVAFFLELVAYHDDVEMGTLEFARLKPEIVARGLEEFSHSKYAVDVFKVGVPVSVAFVEGVGKASGPKAYTREQALGYFRRSDQAAAHPFIYLSEGVSAELFHDALELAAEAGSRFSGVLCGRATWSDGVEIYVKHGISALEEWLSVTGLQNVEALNVLLTAAKPWYAFDDAKASADIAS
jgi:tagatose 1,6-diphosphate aldolase